MVERQPSKLHTWVRFPSPAPTFKTPEWDALRDEMRQVGAPAYKGKTPLIHLQGSFYPLTRKVNDKALGIERFTR
jgi:hypothetical protein